MKTKNAPTKAPVKPGVKPGTKPGRVSPIPRKEPSVKPRPKAEAIYWPYTAAEKLVKV